MTENLLLGPEHSTALTIFLGRLGDDDQTFLGAHVSDTSGATEAVGRWAEQRDGRYRVALARDDRVVGLVGLERGTGWSSHVGRLRLVIAPEARGEGAGRALAMLALRDAVELGVVKVVVEVRSDQGAVISLFQSLGFQPEALLADHLRSSDGRYFDLVTLVHRTDEIEQLLAVIGSNGVGA